ncbi:PREDICTED: collagen alpha-1(I) chain-like, partial [Chinchilla lanigera]|uniref:collagen alpha-1(I) chain-like n=1 Tax=Chinchilla lanigera TaxID=34839 RepID=UPI0006991D20
MAHLLETDAQAATQNPLIYCEAPTLQLHPNARLLGRVGVLQVRHHCARPWERGVLGGGAQGQAGEVVQAPASPFRLCFASCEYLVLRRKAPSMLGSAAPQARTPSQGTQRGQRETPFPRPYAWLPGVRGAQLGLGSTEHREARSLEGPPPPCGRAPGGPERRRPRAGRALRGRRPMSGAGPAGGEGARRGSARASPAGSAGRARAPAQVLGRAR